MHKTDLNNHQNDFHFLHLTSLVLTFSFYHKPSTHNILCVIAIYIIHYLFGTVLKIIVVSVFNRYDLNVLNKSIIETKSVPII